MNKVINSHRIVLIRIVFLLALFLSGSVYSQYVRVNRVWGGVSAAGDNTGVTYGGANLNLFADYGAFGCRFQGGEGWFGGWVGIGMDNWKNAKAFFVPKDSKQTKGRITTPLVNYTRYANPTYTVVSGGKTTSPPANDLGTGIKVDATKCIGTSDQTVTVTNKYSCGVKLERKVLAWGQNYHNNYAIVDLTLTNDTTLTFTNFYVFLHDGEYQFQRADGTNPGIAAIDAYANTRRWYHYYGSRKSDSLRVFYNYSSDDPEIAGDRIGQPLTQQGGRLVDYEATFMATLHASLKPYTPSGVMVGNIDKNDADDMNQPMVTNYANLQNNLNLPSFSTITLDPVSATAVNYYNFITGETLKSEDMTSADVRPGHHRVNQDELNKKAPGAETAVSDLSNTFESMVKCYGPYTIKPGEQIRIVKAIGIAGMSRTKAIEIGKAWYKDTKNGTTTLIDPAPNSPKGSYPSNFVFPDNASATDIKKDKWVSTEVDSVHMTVSRAKYNFKHNYNAPVTPPPPTTFNAVGTSQGIVLTWSDPAAENMSNFAGYRIMKKVGGVDTTYYQEVYKSNASDKGASHSFTDTKVIVAATYYYYVQAIANVSSTDQNAHPTERGKQITSGRVYFYVNTPLNGDTPPRAASALDGIAIVPNPFNYKDPRIANYQFQNPTNLQISFFELPFSVTIRIFTENGDLVKTINHDRDSGFEKWNMVNEAGQTIASGVYVVVFQTPDGGVSYQKLVVVR